jgi:hypothetical protein
MKIRSKVRAGRGCGPFVLPPPTTDPIIIAV